MCMYICQGTLLLLWSQHLPTHTYYTYGALVVPPRPPLALLAYSNQASEHTTLFPYFDLDSDAGLVACFLTLFPQLLLLGSLFVMLASCDRHNFSFFSSNMRVYICIYKKKTTLFLTFI